MTEELKKADNQIDINKQRINQIDSQIDSNKNKMRVLNEMEDGFSSLSMNIEKCVDLLNQSIKGNNIERKLGDISENNKVYYNNIMSSIDEQKIETNEKIKKLYNYKDNIEKEQRELYRLQEEKIHEYKEDKEEDKKEE